MSTLRAISYAFKRFVLRRSQLTARHGEQTFRVNTEDVVGRHIYKYGQHDPLMSDYLRRTLQPRDGDLLIDIGANIGWFSVLFAEACHDVDAKVLAFEPDPNNYALLQHNVAANALADKVVTQPLALSDNQDGATLHLFSGNNRGRHSLLPIHDGETVEIPTARLDDVISHDAALGAGRPALLKIDIEGFELIALRGAPDTLARCPLVVLEYSPEFMRRGDLEPSELLQLMHDSGFSAHRLTSGALDPVSRDQLQNDDQQVDLIWTRPKL